MKKIILSLLALLLVTSMLTLCLASCDNVTVINLDDDGADKDDEDEDETKKKKETTDKTDEDSQDNEDEDSLTQSGDIGLVVDPNQGDFVAPETEVQPGIAIPGWGELTMPPNQTENIVVDFYNPEANAGKYYLTFKLYINKADGTEDVLYESQLIPPGQHIQSIKLNHALEEGEYDATIHVQPYKMDGSLASTNNLDAKLKLIVK